MGAFGGGAGGAVAVYTKRGNEAQATPGKSLNKKTIIGYSAAKEFYSPSYKDLARSSEIAADFRSTLYWNPMVLTDGIRKK
jgi:hypothetical protein